MENANQYANPTVPTFHQTEVPHLKELTENAFSNGLASVIMAEFPVASIFAIFKGHKAQKLAREAEELGARYGIGGGGKATAGKIMGKIGKIVGIVLTAFWGFYFFILFMAMMSEV